MIKHSLNTISFCGCLFFLIFSVNALPKSTIVTDSTIENTVTRSKVTAVNKSGVNTGVKLTNSKIKNSEIRSAFQGNIQANRSGVNTGVMTKDGKIENSTIENSSKVNISASNAQVNTGVAVDNARWAKISSSTSGNISASNSRVKAGAVEGSVSNKTISTSVGDTNIQAHNRSVSVGSVVVHDNLGGNSKVHKDKNDFDYRSNKSNAGAGIGNVEVNSSRVREVDITVGGDTGNMLKGIKTRHLSKVYSKNGGVDESGCLHVYGNKKQRARAEKGLGSAANAYIGRSNTKVRKVSTYVE